MCELRDPSGLSTVTNAINSILINESQVICLIEQNQVSMHVYDVIPSVQLTPIPPHPPLSDYYSRVIYDRSDGTSTEFGIDK